MESRRAGRSERQLPRGRHGLSREDIAASQRGRLVAAILDVVAVKGYPATTVNDVVVRAEVSRRTFYEHFDGKEACFLAAFDAAVLDVGVSLRSALDPVARDDWQGRIRLSWRAFLAALAEHPAAAWSLYIETLCAGPALVERTTAVNRGFADIFRALHRRARAADPGVREVAPEVFDLYVGGTAERIRDCLHTAGAAALPRLEDVFTDTLMVFFEPRPTP
ncbi:Transcriptional regulator, TetR family [Actinokineospora spheciospongiae]|uniref:Transcriptional regulator, TetR family n=1 Tax=Actinokineospora spheciospongiae TaxID=909613 RepID=W7IGF5_9PSEU|nr:helix-turn-helix domain-containing protein [Actinokineospora spheciospongiae]EWC59975.1 Transcriptional regulator, TetR family [Actinokineospora spheciospongiae]PWW59510.1 TetR family transcriptional regulator [Actinokineospora spheciospongiae]